MQFHIFCIFQRKLQKQRALVSEGEMFSRIVSVTKCVLHLEDLNQEGRVGNHCDYSIFLFVCELGKNINSLNDYRENSLNSQQKLH